MYFISFDSRTLHRTRSCFVAIALVAACPSWHAAAKTQSAPERDTVDSRFFRPDALEGGIFAGGVLSMDRYQRAWTEASAARGVTLALRHRTLADRDAFAADYGFPEWAIGIQIADYSGTKLRKRPSPDWGLAQAVDYVSSPGAVVSLVGSFSRPLLRGERWSAGYSLEEGLAFCTRPYRTTDNVDNELTGSHLLLHFGASVYADVRLGRRWRLRGDLAFRHVSNGATDRPNKGLNAFVPTLTLQHDLDETDDPRPKPREKRRFHRYWFVHLDAGGGVHSLIEDWLRTQYGTPPGQPNYRTDRFTPHLVANVQLDVMRRYARRWATGVGLDFFILPYARELARLDAQTHPEARHSTLSWGVAAKHEAYYGPLSAYVHLGWYLRRHTGSMQQLDETPYYERVGLRYRLPFAPKTTVSVGIKAHRLKADFTEVGLGFEW